MSPPELQGVLQAKIVVREIRLWNLRQIVMGWDPKILTKDTDNYLLTDTVSRVNCENDVAVITIFTWKRFA